MLKIAYRIEKGDNGQDRVAYDHRGNHWVVVVADGAGGTGGGADAAQTVCDGVMEEFHATASLSEDTRWGACLKNLDRRMQRTCQGGLTTAIVVDINNGRITGASVGDSEAWLVLGMGTRNLTQNQKRRPFLGSGEANPIGIRLIFMNGRTPGRLLVGTDGLFKYAHSDQITKLARGVDLEKSVNALVDAVRIKNGALQDDVAVVLCEEG